MKVALLQFDMIWEDVESNLAKVEAFAQSLDPDTELFILPEMFTTGFTMNPHNLFEEVGGPTLEWMLRTAKQYHVTLAGSIIVKEDDQFYNRMYWVQSDGTIHHYDKIHLFSLAKETDHYAPGISSTKVLFSEWVVNLQICYDLRFPARLRADLPFDLVIYVASWPQKRIDAWTTLLKARAIENQCYVIGVNRVGVDNNGIAYNGQSAVYGPLGETIINCQEPEGVFYADLSLDDLKNIRRSLPFLDDRDSITIG